MDNLDYMSDVHRIVVESMRRQEQREDTERMDREFVICPQPDCGKKYYRDIDGHACSYISFWNMCPACDEQYRQAKRPDPPR